MTLTELAKTLDSMDAAAPLVFRTRDADIAGGFHVTELKAAKIKSIDCAGRTSEWDEASLQLLDGSGGKHMPVGKFVSILRNSLTAVEALRDAPLHVEFAHGNAGLSRFEIERVEQTADHVQINLSSGRATCKPSTIWASAQLKSNGGGATKRCCA